ncbi:hypothetical protein RMCBS344292_15576 [Rhizopus microsporus]|nr:hypothetical protein RMCBS344292_15576 [Rhizopus microsporus]
MEDSTMQEQQQFVEVNNDSFMNEAAESTKEHEEQSEQPIEEIQLEQQEQPLEEPAKQSTEQPIEQQTETSVEQQNGQPTEQPREPLVEQPTEQFNAEEMKLDEQSNPQSTDEQEQQEQQLEDEPMEEDQAEQKKEETQQEEETMAPLLSAPASWQIPISALTQKASAPTASSNTPFAAPTAASNTATDPPMKRAALRREKLETRIRESKYNVEAWNALINDIQQTGDLDAIRDVYERFLSVFPTSVSFFSLYT